MNATAYVRRRCFDAARWVNSSLFRKPLPNRVAIYFHAIEEDAVGAFEATLDYLTLQGYRFCSPKEYVLAEGPTKRAFISFDDNYVTWFEQLPLFEKHKAKCTFYTNTLPLRDRSSQAEQEVYFDRIGYRHRRVPLSSAELREIAAAGHTIACHTHSHRKLSDIALEEGKTEMLQSKAILEDIVGVQIEDFSYPFGMPRYFPSLLRAYAKTIGFKCVAEAMSCMLHSRTVPGTIQRHGWRLNESLEQNIRYAQVDGRLFVKLFGRSPIG